MLDFLYGSERANSVDAYFLKNFKEDPDYARRWLTDTLVEHRKLIRLEFAGQMEAKKIRREKARRQELVNKFKESEPELAQVIVQLRNDTSDTDQTNAILHAAEAVLANLCAELQRAEALKE